MDYRKIKTFEQACEAKGLDPKQLPDVSNLPERFRKRIIADFKIMVFAEAINDGWVPDYTYSNQRKYTPWFEVKATKKQKTGVSFSAVNYHIWSRISNVGSRLCFETSEKALHAAKCLKKEYIDQQLM